MLTEAQKNKAEKRLSEYLLEHYGTTIKDTSDKQMYYALANISGVSPSTIYSMLNEKSQNPGVVSIKKICDGMEISIREFFNSNLFDDLEQEIK